jgi:flagellar basal body rod protein FlgG
MKLTFILILSSICVITLIADENLIAKYQNLYEDLMYANAPGYKAYSLSELTIAEYDTLFMQGALMCTDNKLDFAVIGNGFFKLWDKNSNTFYYSRNGEFCFDADGYLVHRESGYKLYPILKLTDFKIDGNHVTDFTFKYPNTLVVLGMDNSNAEIQLYEYNFKLYMPEDGSPIKRVAGIYFIFDSVKSIDIEIGGDVKIFAGCLEMSNVIVEHTIIEMLFILERLQTLKINMTGLKTKYYLLTYMLERFNSKRNEMKYAFYLTGFLEEIKEKLNRMYTTLETHELSDNPESTIPLTLLDGGTINLEELKTDIIQLSDYDRQNTVEQETTALYSIIETVLPFLDIEYTVNEEN